jgi:DNA primase
MLAGEAIKSALTMPQICQQYGYQVNRGNFICCPFHTEKTPSLHIKDRSWRCYGCHKSGTVIDFAMELFNLPFKAACERLNADFNLGLSMDKPDPKQLSELRAAQARAREKAEQEERESRAREERWWQVYAAWEYLCEVKKAGYQHEDYIWACHWLERLNYWLEEHERY